MRSVVPMRTAKIGYIVLSLALCGLGGCLICMPDFSLQLLGYLCGGLLAVFGAFKLVGYFSKDLYRLAFQHDLACGILLLALGTVLLIHPGAMMEFYCVILGLYILADALLKIQTAVDAKQFGLPSWWVILIFAIMAGTLGFALILRPSQSGSVLMVLLGVNLLAEGILNLITVLMAVKIVRHQKPDVIDTDIC